MVKLAILCSGQGAQHAGMFRLIGDAAAAEPLFAHATKLLGRDPRDWVRTAPPERLFANESAQVLCTLQGLAAATALPEVLRAAVGVAGYSVGELAAWGVSGRTDPCTMLDLAHERAALMNDARREAQGMLFVRGLDAQRVARLCHDREAAIAIFNPGDACVLGGTVHALQDIAEEAGKLGATRVVWVHAEIASHTFLMKEAAGLFRTALAALPTMDTTGSLRLFSGVDGEQVNDPAAAVDKLALQIACPVRWDRCLEGCIEAGATAFLELGPGRALAAMASAAYPRVAARSLEDFRSLQGVVSWLAQLAS